MAQAAEPRKKLGDSHHGRAGRLTLGLVIAPAPPRSPVAGTSLEQYLAEEEGSRGSPDRRNRRPQDHKGDQQLISFKERIKIEFCDESICQFVLADREKKLRAQSPIRAG